MIKKIFLGLVVLIIVALGVSYLRLNSIVKTAVEQSGPDVLQVAVRLDDVNLSPFSGEASLSGFGLGHPKDWQGEDASEMVAVEDFSIALVPSTLLDDHIIINSIDINEPTLHVKVDGKKNNFISFAGQFETGEETETSPITLTVKDMWIRSARLKLDVKGFGLADTDMTLADIHLESLGTDEKGLAPKELARHVMAVLEPQIRKALVSAQGKKLIGGILNTGSDGVSGAEKLIEKGIKGLLGKKKDKDEDSN